MLDISNDIALPLKVTDNTRSYEVDLAIQRCGETPHGVSSPLVVGVAALVTKLFRTSLPFFFLRKKFLVLKSLYVCLSLFRVILIPVILTLGQLTLFP